jgi:magnesium-transporting ATPase (P-type)
MPPALASKAPAPESSAAPNVAPLAIDPQERIDSLLAHLGTRVEGLSSREAQRRLTQYGANQISRAAGHGRWRELVRQLAHPLALLLWVDRTRDAASPRLPTRGPR